MQERRPAGRGHATVEVVRLVTDTGPVDNMQLNSIPMNACSSTVTAGMFLELQYA